MLPLYFSSSLRFHLHIFRALKKNGSALKGYHRNICYLSNNRACFSLGGKKKKRKERRIFKFLIRFKRMSHVVRCTRCSQHLSLLMHAVCCSFCCSWFLSCCVFGVVTSVSVWGFPLPAESFVYPCLHPLQLFALALRVCEVVPLALGSMPHVTLTSAACQEPSSAGLALASAPPS